MSENKLAFKLDKHKKLWDVMPDYILKIISESKGALDMTSVINQAKHRALTDLFPEEGYVVYDCFACQYTRSYGELYLEEADEKNCHYCPLVWKDGLKCGFRGNLLYLLEHMDPKKLNETRLRNLCKKITELPVAEGIETEGVF